MGASVPRRRVVITIPSEAYYRLAELAEAEERAVDQQASLLLKRLLVGATATVGHVSAERVDAQHDAGGRIPAATPAGALS